MVIANIQIIQIDGFYKPYLKIGTLDGGFYKITSFITDISSTFISMEDALNFAKNKARNIVNEHYRNGEEIRFENTQTPKLTKESMINYGKEFLESLGCTDVLTVSSNCAEVLVTFSFNSDKSTEELNRRIGNFGSWKNSGVVGASSEVSESMRRYKIDFMQA